LQDHGLVAVRVRLDVCEIGGAFTLGLRRAERERLVENASAAVRYSPDRRA
jgi:hypothetical protein